MSGEGDVGQAVEGLNNHKEQRQVRRVSQGERGEKQKKEEAKKGNGNEEEVEDFIG